MTLRPRLGLTILLTAIPLVAGLVWLRNDIERRATEDALTVFAVEHMEALGRTRCEQDPASFGGDLRRGGPHRQPARPRPERRPDRRGRESRRDSPARPAGDPRSPPRRDGDGRRRLDDGPEGRGAGRRRPDDAPQAPPPLREEPRPHRQIWAYDATFQSANPRAPAFPAELRAALASGEERAGGTFEEDGQSGPQVAVRMTWDTGPCAIVLVRRFGAPRPSVVPDLLLGAAIVCGVLLLAVLFAAGPIVRRIRRLTSDVRASAATRYAVAVDVQGSDEIAGLATAFNEAGAELRSHLEDLEKREKTLRAFVANTTHDVMLPLTVLQGHLSHMRKHLERGGVVDGESVRSSLEEAHYLGSLVHNLSAAAKLEAGEKHIQRYPVDLNALVERVMARHRPMASGREIALDFSVPEASLSVEGDVTLIEQSVSNLVHNAVRYNKFGGHVAVLLEGGADEGQRFSLRVIDDGPGIGAEELARLPERRFRGEAARTRHPDGLGLGLHIARDVAERHGFELTFRASEYGGLEAELNGGLLPQDFPRDPEVADGV